jgi:transcriptional regulator with XRE-family HTH domain
VDVQKDVRRVLKALADAIEDHDLNLRAVERRAGWQDGYLSQVLNRRVKLRLEHVLAVLAALGVPPGPFFAGLFAGGGPAGEVAEGPASGDLEALRGELEDLRRLAVRNAAEIDEQARELRELRATVQGD